MTVRELREKYLAFFESKGHRRFPSGSLVPIDVTDKLDESLLFNGAGMIQFKPYFRGIAKPDHPRLTTVQKCVRTNDIDEVGDATHLSFFEMLGNFSFGDYFKNQAIDYSWEFLTSPEWLGLDPKKLAFTIFETDEDAFAAWSLHLNSKDIDPETRVFRLDEETNYWPAGAFSKGPPGPCGPNSEMFYWTADTPPPSGAYGREDFLRDDAAGNWVEIWNDVFIQYEWQGHPDPSGKGYFKDGMPELPFRSIDTGMGLDRTAFVLAGKKSVYENGSFDGVFRILNELTGDGLDYATDPSPKGQAARIIADHVRNATFCISDGITPGNNGRGYVVKRLIRRAILKGQRTLGLSEPFLYKAFEGVVETMGDFYTELEERRATIVETLRNEEEAFRRTLANGYRYFLESLLVLPLDQTDEQDWVDVGIPGSIAEWRAVNLSKLKSRLYPGDQAFKLYGTYGFPLEVTQELAAEAGIEVDLEGYERALKEDQALARGAQGEKSAYGDVNAVEEHAVENAPATTEFTGYCETSGTGRIVRVRPVGRKAPGSPPPTPSSSPDDTSDTVGGSTRGDEEGALRILVALDTTPFYAASGGQVGDTGMLTLGDGSVFHVKDTTKEGGTFWHNLGSVDADLLGKTVTAQVDANRRRKIQRNHTATHLLQAALRETLGGHVTQAGSLVDPDRLRFDFAHGKALTPQEIETVERRVVERILANEDVVTHPDLPIAEAKARGAMALFGEKYGDRVRMVEVGEFSRELCGGIHVRTAGEIGGFRIVSESSAAGGVRRIEAVTGEAAYELARQETQRIREAASLLKASPAELVQAVERAVAQVKEEKGKREKAERAALSGEGGGAETVDVNGVALWRRDFGDVDPKTAASAVDDAAAQAPNQVTLAAVVSGGKIQFIAKAGADAVAKGAHAGNLLREVARIAGGGGGGQAQFATAGGKDPAKVAEALAVAEAVLRGQIK